MMRLKVFKSHLLPVLLTSVLMLIGVAHPAEDDGLTFRLNVVQDQYLPPAMYGTWNIRATVLKTTAPPWFYSPAANEIWALQKEQDAVTLTNVVTHATASILVDKVDGDTATFHHEAKIPTRKMKILEVPTITVNGDKLSGINRQKIFVYNRQGEVLQSYDVDIHVSGQRLAGAQVTFGNPENRPLEFEVAPLQFKDD